MDALKAFEGWERLENLADLEILASRRGEPKRSWEAVKKTALGGTKKKARAA